MKTIARLLAAATFTVTSSWAYASSTAYEFETITVLKLDQELPSITGVLRNASTTTKVTFIDRTNVSFRYVVNRCVPVFLTMMEKPGKYYLTLVVDDSSSANVALLSCTLEVR